MIKIARFKDKFKTLKTLVAYNTYKKRWLKERKKILKTFIMDLHDNENITR
jgi:hypothetical protein